MADQKVKEFGQFLVADPEICHGKWTFRGTRILVSVVLAQVARGEPWDQIVRDEWDGKITTEAIAEAIQLARTALRADEKERRPTTLSA